MATFMEDLEALDNKPMSGKGCSIVVTREQKQPIYSHATSWVSGIPYQFSAFNDRAFVFADRNQAQGFIDAHPDDFSRYQEVRIVEWS